MLFTMIISLFTIKLVLQALGAEDFGLYNVVAGMVVLMSFFTGTLATASQRFFSFDLGQKRFDRLEETFRITFIF